jgi:hypothetical protein
LLFLNYKEVDYGFIYKSTLKNLFFKQNLKMKHTKKLNVPKVKLFFDYRRIVELNLLKISYNIMLIWLLTGKIATMSNIKSKFERGIRYHSFICYVNIDNEDLFLRLIDVIINSYFLLRENQRKMISKQNFVYTELKNLEIFSNVRLSNYYTPRVLNYLGLLFELKNNK